MSEDPGGWLWPALLSSIRPSLLRLPLSNFIGSSVPRVSLHCFLRLTSIPAFLLWPLPQLGLCARAQTLPSCRVVQDSSKNAQGRSAPSEAQG